MTNTGKLIMGILGVLAVLLLLVVSGHPADPGKPLDIRPQVTQPQPKVAKPPIATPLPRARPEVANVKLTRPFKTDGCSGGVSALYRFLYGKAPKIEECCVAHDRLYYRGGSSDARAKADEGLRICIAKKGYPNLAVVFKWAVKFGGQPFFPFDWRWGFGRDYSASWWYDRS